jgi:putative spermidine/putrescine transport system substrate-binding protein
MQRVGTRFVVSIAALSLVLTACSSTGTGGSASASASAGGSTSYEQWKPDDALLTAAKGEGTLSTIALPHDWCNYGESLSTFASRTGLKLNELKPTIGSGEEVEAVKANKDNPGPQAPDVIDVGLSYGPSTVTDGIVQPYKVKTWDSIPAESKDADGNWYGDYYGVLAFEVNTAVVKNVPQDWSDLLKPEYKGQVTLAGDPRSSNQATLSVYAAGLANGGTLDNAGDAGMKFFNDLNKAGNLKIAKAGSASIAKGDTPIAIRWTYNALANRDATAKAGGPKIEVVVPKSGRLAGVYVQAISKYAPHPNAAKLWEEFLYSDEGQNTWLKGYCHPIRYNDLTKNNKVPADQLAKLPDLTGAQFPTGPQLDAQSKAITTGWDSKVGANIPK